MAWSWRATSAAWACPRAANAHGDRLWPGRRHACGPL
jgi:hypothetical protein